MKRIEEHINNYIFWQNTKLSDIKDIKIEDRKHHEEIFKKTLIFPLIDSMSKVYSKKNGNKDCFIDLVDNLSDWDERNKISLVHLYQFLKKINNHELVDIETICDEKYAKLVKGHIYNYEIDIEKDTIKNLWPKVTDGNFKTYQIPNQKTKFTFENFTHLRLLYTYRNYCIHEFRSAGTDLPISRSGLPNYINMSHNGTDEWTLSYPVAVFIRITESIITNLKKYLLANDIDPYESFEFSRYWIEEIDI
jgi:hypothetical protein